MAIPKGGFFKDKVEQGRYGPIFPMTPACCGFSVIAKVIPGMEEHLYNNAKVMEKARRSQREGQHHSISPAHSKLNLDRMAVVTTLATDIGTATPRSADRSSQPDD